jgi:hypothetical protein
VGKSRRLFENFDNQRLRTTFKPSSIKDRKLMVPAFMKQNKTKFPDMKHKNKGRFLDYDSDDNKQDKDSSPLIHHNHKTNSVKSFKNLRDFIPTYKLKMKKKKIEMHKKVFLNIFMTYFICVFLYRIFWPSN